MSLFSTAKKWVSLTHMWSQKLLNLKLQLQIQSLTRVDDQISSLELHCSSIWISSESHKFWWWNEVNPMNGLQDINYTSMKPETAETEAATVEVNIDLRGLEEILI